MKTFSFINADVVTPDGVIEGETVVVEGERIVSVGGAVKGREIDLAGSVLMPGLIDLHCDAIEKEVEPRPGVLMPLEFAIRQIDTRNLTAGITTIFHCVSFAGEELGVRNPELASEISRLVHVLDNSLSVRNRIHARYEVSHPEAMPLISDLMEDRVVELLSFMDHTPGQGQFKEEGAYKRFLMKTYHKSDEEAVALIEAKTRESDRNRHGMERLARQAMGLDIHLISHDDDSPEKVREMYDLGVRISEFPVNAEAGIEARSRDMAALVGSPNVVRGRSQSKGVSAREAISKGAANCLCSDYIPATILPAIFQIADSLDWDFAEAVALATSNPADAAGLNEQGRIAEGMVADLISVSTDLGAPEVNGVWVDGKPKMLRVPHTWK